MECTDDRRLLAVPFLKIDKDSPSDGPESVEQFVHQDEGFIVCEDEEELWKLYDLVYGDDGCNVPGLEKGC